MKRVLTALVLFPVITSVVLWAPQWGVIAVTAAVALLCFYEYSGIAAAYQAGRFGPLGYGAGLLVLVLPSHGQALLAVTAAALIALSLALRAGDLRAGIVRAAFLLMGVVYIFGCWRSAIYLRGHGAHWLMYALLVSWTGDIGAYYIGKAFGRHRLADRISPKKSWEGAAASVATSVLLAGAYLVYFTGSSVAAAVTLTAVANVAGQLGDLVESAMKRGAGVKDSGGLLPGHGGFLDRVDSALFVMPVVSAWLFATGR